VLRYPVHEDVERVDGLPPGEGAFLPCTFWLAECLSELGRTADARETFERVLAVRTDLGLLSEEYDTGRGRLVGNFPQAFSHVGLVNTAYRLAKPEGRRRGQATSSPQR
jgi:GH15 family glucan-1,4-alpha-glucosidase